MRDLRELYGDALDVACPACGVQPGEACVRDFAMPASPLGVPMDCPHAERVEAAAFRASVEAGMGGGAVHEASATLVRDVAGEVV